MEILLTPEERELVREILQERQRELLKEIFHTDHHEYRDGLRRREKLLEGVVTKLEAKAPAAA
jgi:cation transport regulator ChaB